MRRVLVIGNLALDETLAVAAFPEPGASVAGKMVATGPGGKGANQAVSMARALNGVAGVRLLAALGTDARSAALATAMAAEPLSCDLIRRELATDFSLILRSESGENTIVTTQDCARSLSAAEGIAALPGADMLVLQGNLRPDVSAEILQAAGAAGIFRVLNPSPVEGCTAEMLAACDLLVVNEGEAAAFGGAAPLSKGKALVRTLGAEGAELWQDGSRQFGVAGVKVQVADTTGAGDCFLGALIAAMIRRGATAPLAADLALAAWAAGICVSRLGTQNAFPTIAEFETAFAAD